MQRMRMPSNMSSILSVRWGIVWLWIRLKACAVDDEFLQNCMCLWRTDLKYASCCDCWNWKAYTFPSPTSTVMLSSACSVSERLVDTSNDASGSLLLTALTATNILSPLIIISTVRKWTTERLSGFQVCWAGSSTWTTANSFSANGYNNDNKVYNKLFFLNEW
jgi:hypothetical protein